MLLDKYTHMEENFVYERLARIYITEKIEENKDSWCQTFRIKDFNGKWYSKSGNATTEYVENEWIGSWLIKNKLV